MGEREGSSAPGPARREGGEWGATDDVMLALTLGLAFGLGEVLAVGWRIFGRGQLTHITPHVIWMAPVGYAGFFVLLLVLPWLLRALRRGRGPGVALALFCTLGFVGWLEMSPLAAIHPAASWILAAGAGAQTARLAARHRSRLRRAVRYLGPSLALGVSLGAAALVLHGRRSEAVALAELGDPPPSAPNVLLLVLDTVRAKSLGLYGGNPLTTPNLEEIASTSIVFDRAVSTSPWTLPSHASMFTGRWPHQLSVGWSAPLDDAEPTLAEVLADAGYATAGLVANLSYGARPYGLHRGFAHYEDFPVSPGQVVLSTSLGRVVSTMDPPREALGNHELLNRKTAADLRRDLADWLEERPERPFFVFMNFFDAHEPYEPPEPYRSRFAGDRERTGVEHRHNLLRGINARGERRWTLAEDEMAVDLALYEASIAALDAELGRIFDDLAERGLLESTWLVVTSDHGEQLGEHGMVGHQQSLYQPLTHVPLLIRPPGGREGRLRVSPAVSLIDLPATILDVAGVEAPGWPGLSLAPLWGAEPGTTILSPAVAQLSRGLVEQPWYPIARGVAMQAMVSGTLHYICNPDATEELYDLAADPEETTNLAVTAPGRPAVRAFRSRIAAVGAPPPSCPPPPEQEPRAPARRP